MNYRILFETVFEQDEVIAEFVFCDDAEAFFNSDHFRREYGSKNPRMEARGIFDRLWKPYEVAK